MISKSKRGVIVSVVVPTYKRPDMLIRCLAALMAQDYDAQAYEIIIADDAACAETRQVVESWTQGKTRPYPRHTLHYVPVTGNHGPLPRAMLDGEPPQVKSLPLPMMTAYPLLAG